MKLSRIRFTLIEILVVTMIISVIASMLLPAIVKSNQKASRTICMNNLIQFGQAVAMFADDHGEYLPDHSDDNFGSNWNRSMYVCRDYYGNAFEILKCPDDLNHAGVPSDPTAAFPYDASKYHWSYCYNSRMINEWPSLTAPSTVNLKNFLEPKSTIIYLEGNENDGGIENNGDGPVSNPTMEPFIRHDLQAHYLFADFHVEIRSPYSLSTANFTTEAD